MKNTGRRSTCEGKWRPRTVSSMRHLLSKCGMPVRFCADPTECRRSVRRRPRAPTSPDACPAPLPARRPLQTGVLYPNTPPRAGQRTAQRRLVIEIALDNVDAVARQRRCVLALRLPASTRQPEPAAVQRLRDRPP